MTAKCRCGLDLSIWQNPWNHEAGCSMQPVDKGQAEASPATADVQRELAEALMRFWADQVDEDDVADLPDLPEMRQARDAYLAALLPTVQRLIADAEKRAAAAELRERADVFDAIGEAPAIGRLLRARAAALDPSGAVDEAAGR